MLKKGEKKQVTTSKTKNVIAKTNATRVRKGTRKQSKIKAKEHTHTRAQMPGSFSLVGRSFIIIKRFWRPLLGIVVIYSFLNLIFASGLVSAVNSTVGSIADKQSISDATNTFSDIVSNSGNNDTSAAQTLLLILESLVIIWTLRHLFSAEKVNIKDAYYKSMTPLVPFLLVVLMIIIQLLPLTLGAATVSIVFSTVSVSDAAITALIWLIFALLAAWSIFMVSSSIFALYIVTLPDMYPLRALRSAKNLTRFRKWSIIRRLLFLPIFVIVFMGLIIIPLIMWAHFLVSPLFFILCMLTILFAHTYIYNLYKGLLA